MPEDRLTSFSNRVCRAPSVFRMHSTTVFFVQILTSIMSPSSVQSCRRCNCPLTAVHQEFTWTSVCVQGYSRSRMVNIKSRDDVKNQSRTHDKPARRFMNISRPFVNNAERQASRAVSVILLFSARILRRRYTNRSLRRPNDRSNAKLS